MPNSWSEEEDDINSDMLIAYLNLNFCITSQFSNKIVMAK
jgi:hypothetical protein